MRIQGAGAYLEICIRIGKIMANMSSIIEMCLLAFCFCFINCHYFVSKVPLWRAVWVEFSDSSDSVINGDVRCRFDLFWEKEFVVIFFSFLPFWRDGNELFSEINISLSYLQ